MTHKNITEETLEVKNPLVKKLFCQYGWKESDEIFKMNGTANVVYLKGKTPLWITGTMKEDSDVNSPHNFTELLNTIRKPNFADYLLLASFYEIQNEKLQKVISSPAHFGEVQSIDTILYASKGYLAFSFQYELLAQMVLGVDVETARRVRKNFNIHLPDMYDSFPVKTAKAFMKIVSERILPDCKITLNPNWVGARHLLGVN